MKLCTRHHQYDTVILALNSRGEYEDCSKYSGKYNFHYKHFDKISPLVISVSSYSRKNEGRLWGEEEEKWSQ